MKSNWKERGEVPDTDDEEEDDDSLSVWSDAGGNTGDAAKELQGPEKETASPSIVQEPRKQEPLSILEQAEQSAELKARLFAESSSQRFREEVPDSAASEDTLSTPEHAIELGVIAEPELPIPTVSRPSPSQRRAPTPVDEWLEQQQSSQLQDVSQIIDRHQHASSIRPAEYAEDEISKTYVRISSSSLSLSSIASSHFAELESQFAANREQTPAREEGVETEAILHDPQDTRTDVGLSLIDDEPQHQSTGWRSLRPRTNIQLHPFLIEAERHKNQFKRANLAPLRIVATQETAERARKAAEPRNEDSQDTDFVTEGDSQESQGVNDREAARALEELMSSPIRPPRVVSRDTSRQLVVEIPRYRPYIVLPGLDDDDEDDEDLPEISDLLRPANPDEEAERLAMRRRNFKRIQARLKRAEARDNAPAKPRPQPKPVSIDGDVLDVPDSPPATSSPAIGPIYGPTTTPTASARPNQRRAPASTLPTPAASSSARRAAPTPIEVPDDDIDAPTSSIEQSNTSSPLREPPPKLQKMLKGVLPASYLHLNNKIDKPRLAPPPARMRDSRSISPNRERDLNRRGVALPRTADRTASSTPQPGGNGLEWLQDDEESDDNRARTDSSPMRGLIRETNDDSQNVPSVYSMSEFDFAMEDNDSLINPMLPSQHRKRPRQTQLFPGQRPLKRHQGSSTNLFRNMHGGPRYQPRIVDVFDEERPARQEWRWDEDNEALPRHATGTAGLPRRPYIQRAIEEVMPQFEEPVESLPPFMRYAVRSAGSKIALGRRGPARKFVRLDNREDTVEAQSVLRQWRGRSPVQRKPPSAPWAPAAARAPLRDISSRPANLPIPRSNQPKPVARPATLQTSLKAFRKPAGPRQRRITGGAGGSRDQTDRIKVEGRAPKPPTRRPPRRRDIIMPARTAQLEMSQAQYVQRNNQAAFGANKRSLDQGFRHQHRESDGQNNLTLQRFLEDSDEENVGGVPSTAAHIAETINRRRKRAPKQIDAETARYRQPENIVASIELPTPTTSVAYFDDELRGLGGPETLYPIDFDIKPLRADVYFHESTFVGNGRLSRALDLDVATCLSRNQHKTTSYTLSGKDLIWGVWDEKVSSEIWSCLAWIVERLEIFANIDDEEVDVKVISCMTFMISYFQDSLAFTAESEIQLCIERMAKVMAGMTECLEVLTNSDHLQPGDNLNNRRISALSTFEVVLIFQALRLATTHQSSSQDPNISELEKLLQRAATTSVKLLFIIGLSPLDDLYEDLRQEAFRQGGIREDHGPAQAWVILMHIFDAAKIRRVSFWNAVNAHLLTNIHLESNAKVMERSWGAMFAMLPLMEFDKFGILKSRSRYRHTLENWALAQKLVRRVFDLYPGQEGKNLASYTTYCNTIFNRCHHLIQAWGWRRYGSILGTFFDFFAKHQFSHIGPQKPLAQPEFLRDLDGALSSFVVPDDQCFTVFLKIVHSATQQLREAGDQKGLRNLVTRLLPNTSLDSDSQEEKELSREQLGNHHDLLFTLYWAAPVELRDKIKVMLDSVERRKRQMEVRQWRGILDRR